MNKLIYGGLALAAIVASSCSGPKGWSVEGIVENAGETGKIVLEGYNNGLWYTVDSLSLDNNGRFVYKADAPAHFSEIYRLTSPAGGSIYFPVDSVDKVTVTADGNHFGTGYVLDGTELARTIGRIDSTLAVSGNVDNADVLRDLVGYIIADTTGTVAYYLTGKTVGGKALFDPNDDFGNRVFGAAAQIFTTFAPDDPRGRYILSSYYNGRKALGKITEAPTTVLEADETGYIDVTNYDDRGVKHSLSDYVKDGKVVILSFTAYGTEASVPYNAILNDIYTANHDKGLEIFQISFDNEEQVWKPVARNLPWVTVWNSPSDGVAVLQQYNVGAFPLSFIINRKGEIVSRVADQTKLAGEVAKYL